MGQKLSLQDQLADGLGLRPWFGFLCSREDMHGATRNLACTESMSLLAEGSREAKIPPRL